MKLLGKSFIGKYVAILVACFLHYVAAILNSFKFVGVTILKTKQVDCKSLVAYAQLFCNKRPLPDFSIKGGKNLCLWTRHRKPAAET